MGFLRALLAFSVVFHHIGQPLRKWFIDGHTAVLLFFILSGFYMGLVLSTKYKNQSVWGFYVSRYLRILPVFLFGNFIALTTCILAGSFRALGSWPLFSIWQKAAVVFVNLTGFGGDLMTHVKFIAGKTRFSEFGVDPQHNGFALLLNPPTWSISVELLFYMAAPFLVARPRWLVSALCVCGLYSFGLQTLSPEFAAAARADTYYPAYFPYFAMGLAAYFIYSNRESWTQRAYLALAVGISLLLAMPLEGGSCLYIFAMFAIVAIFPITKDNALDRFVGEMSYPLYVLHVPVLTLLRTLYRHESPFWVTLTTLVVLSALAVMLIERPLSAYRSHLTQRRANERCPVESLSDAPQAPSAAQISRTA